MLHRTTFFLSMWLLLTVGLFAAQQSFGQMTTLGTGAQKVAAGGGVSTFDPANKSANITLSGGNLISTAGGGAGSGTNVRSTTSHSSGKYAIDLTITTAGASPLLALGLVNSTFSIGSNGLGTTINGAGWYGGDGRTFLNNLPVDSSAISFAQGDVLNFVVDVGGLLVWRRINNSGFWNANPAADPATGANGSSISGIGAGALYLAVEQDSSGQVVAVSFTASTPPSGFGAW